MKKRVRKRPRRRAGLRRLRGGRLTWAPSGSCVAEVGARCMPRTILAHPRPILQGQVKGSGLWQGFSASPGRSAAAECRGRAQLSAALAGSPVGYNRCPVERTVFFSGNEAIAHGAVRAGAGFACGYPGTPSTEILETAARLDGIHAEWCVNEKVALETAVGASLAGVRSIVTMKHVGLNVAADPFMTLVAHRRQRRRSSWSPPTTPACTRRRTSRTTATTRASPRSPCSSRPTARRPTTSSPRPSPCRRSSTRRCCCAPRRGSRTAAAASSPRVPVQLEPRDYARDIAKYVMVPAVRAPA